MHEKNTTLFTSQELGIQGGVIELIAWIKKEGDLIQKNELVAVALSDDRPLDIVAPMSGHLTKKMVAIGETVSSTAPLFAIASEQALLQLQKKTPLELSNYFLFDLPATRLLQMKEKWALLASREGIHLALTPFLVKAFSIALKKASLDSLGTDSRMLVKRFEINSSEETTYNLESRLEEIIKIKRPVDREQKKSVSLYHFDWPDKGPFWTNWVEKESSLHMNCSPIYRGAGIGRDGWEPSEYLSFSLHFNQEAISGEKVLKVAHLFRETLLEPHQLLD